MLRDPKAELIARGKRTLRKQLNRPAIVAPFPVEDCSERSDAAVLAWFAKIFELYDIDPASPTRWEQVAWSLAFDLFPNFKIIGKSNIGHPGTAPLVMELFYRFQEYERQRGQAGSKYKNFLRNHAAECAACKLKTEMALKGAMLRARKQHSLDRYNEDLLIRLGAMKALGLI
jgi:hypothetical protein